VDVKINTIEVKEPSNYDSRGAGERRAIPPEIPSLGSWSGVHSDFKDILINFDSLGTKILTECLRLSI
jgi:hypothetical protein